MLKSYEWKEWCLTPNGWEPGCEKLDNFDISGERPNGTVMVIKYISYMDAILNEFSQEVSLSESNQKEVEELGKKEDIKRLVGHFGSEPKKS